jgi:hypothetical protein
MEAEHRRSTKAQLAFALARGISPAKWARNNGVTKMTAYRWSKEPEVRKAVETRTTCNVAGGWERAPECPWLDRERLKGNGGNFLKSDHGLSLFTTFFQDRESMKTQFALALVETKHVPQRARTQNENRVSPKERLKACARGRLDRVTEVTQ